MAYKSTKDARLLIASTDVSDDVNTASAKMTAVMAEHRGLGSTFPTGVDTGQRTGELTCSGLYSGTTDVANILATVAGTARVCSLILGNDAGGGAYCYESAVVAASEVGLAEGQPDTVSPEFTVNGDVHTAFVVAPLATRTTAANLDAADADGLASSTGATAFLHCTAVTGTPDAVTVKVRSSDDAVTYADCTNGTFTDFDDATSEVINPTGTIERYLSISWAYTGGTTPGWTGCVCVARD